MEVSAAKIIKTLSGASENFRIVEGICADFTFSKHFHEEYTLGLLCSGQEEFSIGNTAYRLKTGATYYLNPGDSHSSGPVDKKGWAYRSIYLNSDWLQEMMRQKSARKDINFKIAASFSPLYARLTSGLMNILQQSPCRLEQESALISIMSQLLSVQCPADESTDDSRVARMKSFLRDQVEERFSLAELAAEVAWHPMHALNMFKKDLGITPNAYLISCRLNRALPMIIEGISLAEVAVASGFYDQSHLARHFVRAFGTTPAAYRIS